MNKQRWKLENKCGFVSLMNANDTCNEHSTCPICKLCNLHCVGHYGILEGLKKSLYGKTVITLTLDQTPS